MQKKVKADTSKSTVLVICIGFLFVYLVFKEKWALYASLVIGVSAIASPYLSRKIEWLWMKLSLVLGYIVPNILLTIVFFLFLFPIAFIARLSGKDSLMLSKKYKTYFIDTNDRVIDKKYFEKTW